jgi:DegV family protein with EDD domain
MAKLGDIVSIREEDLIKETTGQPSLRRQDIGIVTDSLADLTDKIMERYSIEMVNLKWEWALDKKVEGENLYAKMRKAISQLTPANSPKTAQPTPREYVDAYKRQLQKFQHVLYLSFSKKLSGSYNSGIQAKEHLQNGERARIYVFDTEEGTGSQALMVLRAIELIQSQFDIHEVIAELEKIHKESRVRVLCSLESPIWLEYGGRIDAKKASLLKFLQKLSIMPILTMKHGVIETHGMSFGTKDQAEILHKKFMAEAGGKIKAGHKVRVVITHCDNPEAAQKLKAKVKESGAEVSFMNLMYPIVGSHLGPGALTLSYMILD